MGMTAAGLCACGCGVPTPIARMSSRRYDHVKGQPIRFIHNHHARRDLAARFWAKVQKGDGPDACWLWTGSKNPLGYGYITVDGRLEGAHRVDWVLTNGPIPPETPCVLHDCPSGDNPSCVRYHHLFLGTKADNSADMVAKGRKR